MVIFFSFTASALDFPSFFLVAAVGFLGFFSTLAAVFLALDGDALEDDAFDDPEGGFLDGAIVKNF